VWVACSPEASTTSVPEEDAIGPLDRTGQQQDRGLRVNEQIRITPVRVINFDGQTLGVIPTGKALETARELGLDLVEVAPSERPPVCKTGDEDIRVKVRRAREFLEHKDKVLVNVLFRGRELAHIDEGRRVMDEVLQLLEDVAKVEKLPSMEGKRLTALVAPRA
jgi:translation initiation factor IF-3